MQYQISPEFESKPDNLKDKDELEIIKARRTAFIIRFIVLREGKKSRAHRVIEQMKWNEDTTAEELAARFREIFVKNGSKMSKVDKDIKRALEHSKRCIDCMIHEYAARSTTNFIDALIDYEKSNKLLFGEDPDEMPVGIGWRLASSLTKNRKK